MLWPSWRGASESYKRVLDILKHGEVDQPRGVVPMEVNPKVEFVAPIMLNGIELLQRPHEVFGMLLENIFDAKIINAKSKRDGAPLVRPKTRCEFRFYVTFFDESFF